MTDDGGTERRISNLETVLGMDYLYSDTRYDSPRLDTLEEKVREINERLEILARQVDRINSAQ